MKVAVRRSLTRTEPPPDACLILNRLAREHGVGSLKKSFYSPSNNPQMADAHLIVLYAECRNAGFDP